MIRKAIGAIKFWLIFLLMSICFSLIHCTKESVEETISVRIKYPANGVIYSEGDTITFTGEGFHVIGGLGQFQRVTELCCCSLVWKSDKDGIIDTGDSIDEDDLSYNKHVITLEAISGGIRGEDEITIYVGSPWNEYGRDSDETLHLVTLTNDFYMSATEITNLQYAFMAQWAYINGYCTATSVSLQDNLDGSTEYLLSLNHFDSEIYFRGGIFEVDSGLEEHPVIGVS